MLIQRKEYRALPTVDAEPAPAVRSRQQPSAGRSELLEAPPHESPERLAFYAGLSAQVAATAVDASHSAGAASAAGSAAGAAIDAKRDAYAGPYQVEGRSVSAPVMFKMGGIGHGSQSRKSELAGLLIPPSLAASVQSGQARPEKIVAATQQLIDLGMLPPPPGDVATRIKQMQWTFGIGIDCACHTRQSLTAVTGKSEEQLGISKDQGLRGLDANRHFTKVAPQDVRPGDVITLDPKPPEQFGHNVIVRSRTVADPAATRALIDRHGDTASRFFSGPGPFHTIEVDSSWGAGSQGALEGGYRRDTWIYDEHSKHWGHFAPSTGHFIVSDDGPAATDKYHGAYRAKGQ